MPREILNPDVLYPSTKFGFSHAAIAQGQRIIYCAGQVAWNKNYELIGPGSIPAQARQALENLKSVLSAAGAGPKHIVRLHTYLVGHTREDLMGVSAALAEFYGPGQPPAPNTVIGVARLAMPEFLVEIEATAVLD